MILVKKYPNRRLYDTDASRYLTHDELAAKIRRGADVRIVDAKTSEDLTQATLTQMILEGPSARLLPIPLLTQLVRMGDDAMGEFFSRYVSLALELYVHAKQGAQTASSWNPLAQVPLSMGQTLARMWLGGGQDAQPQVALPTPPPSAPAVASPSELAALRKELDALKKKVGRKRR